MRNSSLRVVLPVGSNIPSSENRQILLKIASFVKVRLCVHSRYEWRLNKVTVLRIVFFDMTTFRG